jgi:DNA-binding helix-hairpin-helix protein with protein kinase domain
MTEEFDRVEEVLVSRYNILQTEIIDLQEKLEFEKLTKFQAEEELRKREELCERHKNNYETLLKEIKKKTSLTERDNIGELRKKKWMDDNNALSEPPMKRSKDAQGASSSSGMKILHFFRLP